MRLPLSTVIGQEGIVAKRLVDPYGPRTKWWKILNQDYSQQEDRHAAGGAWCHAGPDFSSAAS